MTNTHDETQQTAPQTKSRRTGRIAAVAVAIAAAVIAVAGGANAAGNPSIPDNTVDSSDLKNGGINQVDLATPLYTILRTPNQNTVTSWSVKDGSLQVSDLSQAAQDALKGQKGEDAIVSVTAVTNLSARPDSGQHGNWANDAFTRTVAVTRQHAAEASKCGGGSTTCWFYTASLADAGTFKTITDAKSPQNGATIAGTVSGTINGGTKIEFYASSDKPNPASVPVTVTGGAHPTATWVNAFFPDGTVVTESNLLNWSWTYAASATCETWVNKFNGNTGDITGVNHC